MANKQRKNIIDLLKDRAENVDRGKDKGIVNEDTKSSILLNESGDINLAASETVVYKLNHASGQSTEVTYQSNTITNRKNIETDEIIINKHKLNPQFWELTDMKRLYNDPTSGIGCLTVNTTVLVKTWDKRLNKWVLIRRPARMPVFSNMLPLPDVPKEMGLDGVTDISEELETMRKLDTAKVRDI